MHFSQSIKYVALKLRLADGVLVIRLFTLPNTNTVLVNNAYTMQRYAVRYAVGVGNLKKEMTVRV